VRLEGVAIQNEVLLLTQKTSLQHADTPRFGGKFANDRAEVEVEAEAEERPLKGSPEDAVWDCNRTRTTSSGVTTMRPWIQPYYAPRTDLPGL
jgi:hypothetical protein